MLIDVFLLNFRNPFTSWRVKSSGIRQSKICQVSPLGHSRTVDEKNCLTEYSVKSISGPLRRQGDKYWNLTPLPQKNSNIILKTSSSTPPLINLLTQWDLNFTLMPGNLLVNQRQFRSQWVNNLKLYPLKATCMSPLKKAGGNNWLAKDLGVHQPQMTPWG